MVLVVGGTIPNDDIPELKQLGVAEVFTPGAPVQGIIDFIRGRCRLGRGCARAPDSVGTPSSAAIRTAASRKLAISSGPSSLGPVGLDLGEDAAPA